MRPTKFDFPQPKRLAPPILTLEHVSAGYDGHRVLSDVNLSLDMDDRVALLGSNGNGKSTLAKLIAGRLECPVRRGPPIAHASASAISRSTRRTSW